MIKRVVDRLERLGIAIVGAPGQGFQRLEIVRKLGDRDGVRLRTVEAAHRVLGRLPGGLQDGVAVFGDGAFQFVEARADVLEFRQGRGRPAEMAGENRDLAFQAADQIRIDAGEFRGVGVDAGGNAFEPCLQAANGFAAVL